MSSMRNGATKYTTGRTSRLNIEVLNALIVMKVQIFTSIAIIHITNFVKYTFTKSGKDFENFQPFPAVFVQGNAQLPESVDQENICVS